MSRKRRVLGAVLKAGGLAARHGRGSSSTGASLNLTSDKRRSGSTRSSGLADEPFQNSVLDRTPGLPAKLSKSEG